MKLNGRDAKAFLARPDPARPGVLIYGADAMRVALNRQDMLVALLGPTADEEMRLERLDAGELRRTPSAAGDALKATGFFPGQRAVLVEEAGDAASSALATALDTWEPGDAMLVVTAGQLAPRSKLRKLFEGHKIAVVTPIYDDPPGRAEIEAAITRAGLPTPEHEAMQDLEALAHALDPGDFRQTLEKLALYKHDDPTPLTSAEVALLAPATLDAALDDALNAAASGQFTRIGPLMQRLEGQGITPVSMIIAATRHFRTLHAAASHPQGPAAGLARARPPVFGPRREALTRQASMLGRDRLETALAMLIEADLTLRAAGRTVPEAALVERLFLRLAMLARAR